MPLSWGDFSAKSKVRLTDCGTVDSFVYQVTRGCLELRKIGEVMREKILDVAEKLTRSKGVGWSLVDVAKATGISRGSIYRRFRSQTEILEALTSERGVDLPDDALCSVRERVLNALVKVSSERGLVQATIKEVAKVAGVGEATIYRKFGDRKGLLQAYADEKTPRALLIQIDEDSPLEETLFMLALSAVQLWFEHGPFILAGLSPSNENESVIEELRRLEADSRKILSNYLSIKIETGELVGEPDLLAGGLVGLVAGMTLQNFEAAKENSEETARAIVQMFLHGCINRKEE